MITIKSYKVDIPNDNNRIYPKKIMQEVIDNYMKIPKEKRLGIYGYKEKYELDLGDVEFMVESLNILDDEVIGEISIAENNISKKLSEKIKNPDSLRLGFMITGDLKKDIEDEKSDIVEKIEKINYAVLINKEEFSWKEKENENGNKTNSVI